MKLTFCCIFALCVIKFYANADCNAISKKAWGGVSPTHVEYLARPVNLVIIQHTATSTCITDNSCKAIVRSIQDNHMDNLGYWDIGPSFLIGGTGKVYEGSGWLHVGAHTYGYNRLSVGISFIGNFNDDEPTPQALAAAQALIRCGVEKGHLSSNYKLVGHKQLIAIESPGRLLYSEIRRWPHWQENVDDIKKN